MSMNLRIDWQLTILLLVKVYEWSMTVASGIVIKNVEIGGKRPVVCVPVVEEEKSLILQKMEEIVELGVRMIEWRADFFTDLMDKEAVVSLLREAAPIVKDTVLLFTIRSIGQGGQARMEESDISDLLCRVADTGVIDLCDVEYFDLEHAESLMASLQERGVRVIASQHDFMKTPKPERMWDTLASMRAGGADIVKLATTPEEAQDILDLLSVTARFHNSYPKTPVITMSMGKAGVLTRVSGELFGSAVTFGVVGRESAPGQIDAVKLQEILDQVHKYNE